LIMSTRCQIEFVVKYTYNDREGKIHRNTERRLLYRHSDGYPEGVIPDMVKFLRWNGWRTDEEYIAANFIYWSKRDSEDWYIDHVRERVRDELAGRGYTHHTKDFPGLTPAGVTWDSDVIAKDHSAPLKLGYGVCAPNDFHGDIEYFYTVEITQNGNKPNDNILIVCSRVARKNYGDPITRKSFFPWGSVLVNGDGKILRIAGFDETVSTHTDGSLTIDRLKERLNEKPVPVRAPEPDNWLAHVEVE
jgi:hypothetical protein